MADEVGKRLDLVWGAKDIGTIINKTEKATLHLLEKGRLPARKLGRQWVASRPALKRHLTGDDSPEAA